ncbi:MAG: plasmid mobilization relaxosome protein MobC [Sulfurovum sp.]|nr:plasmid mobilization relaxosome protein MobC [Sulfurovum sp.]
MAKRKRYFSKQLKINLTEEVDERVTLLAQEAGLTKSEFFRELINEKTENAQLPEKKEIEVIYKIDKDFFRQYVGIATNINQITKRLNTKDIFEARLMQRVEQKIDQLLECAKK